DEVFKGKLPAVVKLVFLGGTITNRGELDGSDPQLKVGDERLFLVARRDDGTLYAVRGDASVLRLLPAANVATLSTYAAGQLLLSQLRQITAAGSLRGGDVSDQAADTQSGTTTQPPGNFTPFGNPVDTATNLLVDASGIPARFILPDRGEPIPYLIDADYLPT